jgi:hypothetical protein
VLTQYYYSGSVPGIRSEKETPIAREAVDPFESARPRQTKPNPLSRWVFVDDVTDRTMTACDPVAGASFS